uniref:Uncharacterized protein n=1 Tax=Rhinolophus ferrumequinum TaxID=59479 RepID=A0A671DZW5_RHIFE
MLLLLHEQDKMASKWAHPEMNNNNIRLSSEAILFLHPGPISVLLFLSQLQDGLQKGLMQCNSSNRIV